jgi:aryl-alcohol dehydrogenase-like predicted oxidoreductase
MTAGRAADQDRAIAWARDHGINYFDTAPLYGDGASELNLGRALGTDRDGIFVSTKVRLSEDDRTDAANAIRASLEASLTRLKQDHVDLFHLHNKVARSTEGGAFTPQKIFDDITPELIKLRDEGKTRFFGFTGNGETDALRQLIESELFDSAQIFYNILVPSAGEAVPASYPGQDYRQIIDAADHHDVGTIGVRVLAGGALSGSETRHPLSMPTVQPIGSGQDYATDVRRAMRFESLIAAGHSTSLPELAIRFAISKPALSTIEIGTATLDELQQAVNAVNKGPLSVDALADIKAIQASLAAECAGR